MMFIVSSKSNVVIYKKNLAVMMLG